MLCLNVRRSVSSRALGMTEPKRWFADVYISLYTFQRFQQTLCNIEA